MKTANIVCEVFFKKQLSIDQPLTGTFVLTCDCGHKMSTGEVVTVKSEIACFDCPKCGFHLCSPELSKMRDECFKRFRRDRIEAN